MTSSSSGSNESTETSTSAGPGPDLINLPHSGDSNSDMLTIPGKEPNVNRAAVEITNIPDEMIMNVCGGVSSC